MNENEPIRRYVKYVFIDIVGYSKLTNQAQAKVVSEMNEIVRQAVKKWGVEENTVYLPLGDGICICIERPAEENDIHLLVALEILSCLSAQNEQANDTDRFEMRIGINQGTDQLVEDINRRPNYAGYGINITSRISDLADGKQILVSSVVYEDLRGEQKYSERFVARGDLEVKHGELVRVYQYIAKEWPGLDSDEPTNEKYQKAKAQKSETALMRAPQHSANQDSNEALQKTSVPEANKPDGSKQIMDIVQTLLADIAGQSNAENPITFAQLRRLQLYVGALNNYQISGLGVHEINALYLDREGMQLTGVEVEALFRMLICDPDDLRPGWYWLQGLQGKEEDITADYLQYLAGADSSDTASRREALCLLAFAKVPPTPELENRLRLIIESNADREVRIAAINYLGKTGGNACLPIIGSGLVDEDSGVKHAALESKYLILAKINPKRAFNELLTETKLEVGGILAELSQYAAQVEDAALSSALEHSSDGVKLFAVNELIQRKELTVEQAHALKQDKSTSVKAAAYSFLIAKGVELEDEEIAANLQKGWDFWSFPRIRFSPLDRYKTLEREPKPNRDEILLAFYRRFSVEQLTELSFWNNLYGCEAYRALALEHFDAFADRLREDLRTDFAVSAENYYQKDLALWNELPERSTAPLNVADSAIGG